MVLTRSQTRTITHDEPQRNSAPQVMLAVAVVIAASRFYHASDVSRYIFLSPSLL